MKKFLLILGVFLILIITGWIIFRALTPSNQTRTEPEGHVSLPSAGSAPFSATGTTSPGVIISQYTLPLPRGGSLVTNDFIHNKQTVADIENPGTFVLAGSLGYCLADGTCPAGFPTNDFNVSYSEQTHSFNITLLKEPLAVIRTKAENFFLTALGITEAQACTADYYVGVSYYVNPVYSGKNLGFSFCPGAVPLPQ